MYRSNLNSRDKGRAVAGVVAIHVALLVVVLHKWSDSIYAPPSPTMTMFDVRDLPPPPPPPRPQERVRSKKKGGSAPANIKSEATQVVAPQPEVVIPPVKQIAAAEIPRLGAQPTQGASDVRGPGTGAGGTGNGTGSGNGGNGMGSGDGGVFEPPHLVTPVLRGRDIPRETLDGWPRGATVFMRLRIDPQGFVAECTIDRGTGLPSIDNTLCNLAHDRLRFRPAVNGSGQAVAGWAGYAQPAPR